MLCTPMQVQLMMCALLHVNLPSGIAAIEKCTADCTAACLLLQASEMEANQKFSLRVGSEAQ